MGEFSEHVLFGFLVAAVLYFQLGDFLSVDATVVLASVAAVFAGSVLPDVDHRRSYVHRSARAFTSILLGALVFLLLPLTFPQRFGLGVAALLLTYSGFSLVKLEHRGLTHSLSFCVTLASLAVVAGVVSMGSAVPGLALATGLISHLVMDRELKL